ncbi:MAG: hypothetical protein ACK5OC_13390, partial [Pirellula sp.]
ALEKPKKSQPEKRCALLVDVGWLASAWISHLDHRSMQTRGRWWRLSPLLVIWLRLLPDAGKLLRSVVFSR